MNEFLEPHARALYRLLGHDGHYSRVGALDVKSKEYTESYVFGEQAAIDWLKKWSGQRNVFLSRACFDARHTPISATCFTLDIDPIRPAGEAATDEQHNDALNAGRKILKLFPRGYLASSGNGALLLYRCPSVANEYEKHGQIIQELNEAVKEFNVKIDRTNYDKAIVKFIGSPSTKGAEDLRRCSKFITFPIKPYYQPDCLIRRISELENIHSSCKTFSGDPVKRIQEAKQFLSSLDKKRVEDYECWLKVGMALKEFGLAGLSLWKEWSKQSEEKYEEGICETKWESFDETPTVTLSTLAYWAKEDGADPKGISYFDKLFTVNLSDREAIRTGFSGLDGAMGPLPKGEISTFASRSGYGKTTFACTFTEQLRLSGKRALYFSTEMSAEYLMHKLVAIACAIPLARVIAKEFDEAERQRIENYRKGFTANPILIDDSYKPSLLQIRKAVDTHKPDVLVFDHISHIDTNWQNVAEYMHGLKNVARDFNLPTVVMSELNEPGRNSKGEEHQSIRGDVRGSQEVIYLSSVFVYFSNPYPVKGDIQPVQLHIAKSRYGISGITVDMAVDKRISKFLEATQCQVSDA